MTSLSDKTKNKQENLKEKKDDHSHEDRNKDKMKPSLTQLESETRNIWRDHLLQLKQHQFFSVHSHFSKAGSLPPVSWRGFKLSQHLLSLPMMMLRSELCGGETTCCSTPCSSYLCPLWLWLYVCSMNLWLIRCLPDVSVWGMRTWISKRICLHQLYFPWKENDFQSWISQTFLAPTTNSLLFRNPYKTLT